MGVFSATGALAILCGVLLVVSNAFTNKALSSAYNRLHTFRNCRHTGLSSLSMVLKQADKSNPSVYVPRSTPPSSSSSSSSSGNNNNNSSNKAAAPTSEAPLDEFSPKSITKEIMSYFAVGDKAIEAQKFIKRMEDPRIRDNIDGLHVITIMFQSARTRRLAKNVLAVDFMKKRLQTWGNSNWSERDISMFVYGVRSIEGVDKADGEMLNLGAKKIAESTAVLTSRAVGNALYGLQDITIDTEGAAALCVALAAKVRTFEGDLSGQDIGIGLYGLQGRRYLSSIYTIHITCADCLFIGLLRYVVGTT